MSEEEIINKLKERIRIDRSMRLNVESDFDRFCEEECRAIEELIDLYQKEKEKNKELEEKSYKKEYYEEVAEELYKNSIPKSKLEEILDRYAYTKLDDDEKIIRFYKDLQELFEGDK